MNAVIGVVRLPLFALGAILFFVAERYLNTSDFHRFTSLFGLVLMASSAFAAVLLWHQSRSRGFREETRSWTMLIGWQVGAFVSCLVYLGYQKSLQGSFVPENFTSKALLTGWLLLLILSVCSGIGLEWGKRSAGSGPHSESQRVCRAGASWLMIGMSLAILVCINFAAAKRDRAFDWSYLKATTPGEATLNMINTLTEPLEVAIFFSPDNEVLPFVREYFQNLSRQEGNLEISYYDKDLHPTQAERFRVSRNGQIVLQADDRRERIEVGLTIAASRQKLRNMDAEFQRSFLSLTQARQVAYFTRGHGELSWLADSDTPLRSIRLLETFMRNQNFSVRLFGVADGSATEVPDDATLVVIAGPTQPFMEEEVAALRRYVTRGGKLLVLLDVVKGDSDEPDLSQQGAKQDPLHAFLEEIGVRFVPETLANDRNYVAATRSDADRWFLFTNVFTAHESVISLARHEERIPMLLFQSGYFTVNQQAGDWRAFETVRSLADTFNDVNQNFRFDEGSERRNSYEVGAAATINVEGEDEHGRAKQGRIVAFADASAFSDYVISAGSPANVLFISDALRWLAGQQQIVGATNTEEDVMIRHTRAENVIWFHGSVYAVPALVLLVGFIATRRRSTRK